MTDRDALSWLLLRAFIARRVKLSRVDCVVKVEFKTALEAEEFQKFVSRANATKDLAL